MGGAILRLEEESDVVSVADGTAILLLEDGDHPLEADREAARRHVSVEKLADHPVVAPTAGNGRRITRVRHFEDRPRVIPHPPDQGRVEGDVEALAGLVRDRS